MVRDAHGFNPLLMGWHSYAFLAYGHLAGLLELARKLGEIWRQVRRATVAVEETPPGFLSTFSALGMPMHRLGLRGPVRKLAMALDLEWGSVRFRAVCRAIFGGVAPDKLEETVTYYSRFGCDLPAFLADDPARCPQLEKVRAALAEKEEMLGLAEVDKSFERLRYSCNLLEACALAAEQVGDDGGLSAFYAERGLEQYYAQKPACATTCFAVLARAAARRGDPQGARARWRGAAEKVRLAGDPLLALRIGEAWGDRDDDELQGLVAFATAHLGGRSEQEVLKELNQAATEPYEE